MKKVIFGPHTGSLCPAFPAHAISTWGELWLQVHFQVRKHLRLKFTHKKMTFVLCL